jgi:formylmethanofuran:tetrahydromethanopterin formyltransferase
MDSFTQCAIAKFVTKFLSDNGSEELVDKWNDQDNADAFSALVKKACKRSSDKKLKDPNAPKRGRSAYIFFCSKNREKAKERLGEGAKATEVTSELGKMWNELKASTKKADKTALLGFEAEAAEDKSRYDEEKKDYQPPSDEELAKTTAKKGRKTSDKDTNSPKGRKSAYIYFCSAMRAQVKEELGEEGKSLIMTELGKRWKELKEDEQRSEELAEYTKMAEDDKARYQDEKENVSDEKTSPKKSPKKSKKQLVEKPVESEESTNDVKGKKSEEGKTSPKKKTGYSYFCSYNRDSVKSENPKMKGQDITRELARLWKDLTKDEQKEWSDSAETE